MLLAMLKESFLCLAVFNNKKSLLSQSWLAGDLEPHIITLCMPYLSIVYLKHLYECVNCILVNKGK